MQDLDEIDVRLDGNRPRAPLESLADESKREKFLALMEQVSETLLAEARSGTPALRLRALRLVSGHVTLRPDVERAGAGPTGGLSSPLAPVGHRHRQGSTTP